MNEIVNFISTVGFPIAMCVTILYLWRESEKSHDVKIDALVESIKELTLKIEKLLTINEKE